uniref:Uncharacterized protein n=1 Tax=Strigamia maritima TaxID=126957 RepID=T1JL88_STRMM
MKTLSRKKKKKSRPSLEYERKQLKKKADKAKRKENEVFQRRQKLLADQVDKSQLEWVENERATRAETRAGIEENVGEFGEDSEQTELAARNRTGVLRLFGDDHQRLRVELFAFVLRPLRRRVYENETRMSSLLSSNHESTPSPSRILDSVFAGMVAMWSNELKSRRQHLVATRMKCRYHVI